MRTILVILSLAAAAATGFAQGTVTPVGKLKVTSTLDVSGISNKSAVRSDLGTNDAGNLTAGTLSDARLSSDVLLSTGSYANPSWVTSLAWSKLTGTPTTLSGLGISDSTIVLTSGTYSNPTWLTALAWSKVSSHPTTVSGYGITDAVQTGLNYTNPAWITSLPWTKISSPPTNLAGYGITNAAQQVIYVVDGDSRTYGAGSPPTSWFNLLCADPALNLIAKNYGVPGKQVAQIASSLSTTGAASVSVSGEHQWSPAVTGSKGVYFVWASTNDLGGGASASTVLAGLQAIYAAAKTDGYSTVVAFTETPRAPAPGAGWETTAETQRLALNASLRGLTLGQSNTPDVLIDTEKLFPNYSTFSDGVHISAAQDAILAKYVHDILAGQVPTYQPFVQLRWTDSSHTFSTDGEQMTAFATVQDNQGLYNSTNHNIVCPFAGWVQVTASFQRTIGAAGDVWALELYSTPPSGSAALKRIMVRQHDTISGTTYSYIGESVNATVHIPVVAGEILDFRIGLGSGTNGWVIYQNVGYSEFTVRYVPAP